MAEFYKVAKVSEVPPGTKQLVEVDFVPVLLFNVDGEFYAMEDVCTHDGGPLGEGWFNGDEIECPPTRRTFLCENRRTALYACCRSRRLLHRQS